LSPISDNESCISPQIVTFIIQKILADDDGLTYVCAILSQLFAVAPVLKMKLESLEMQRLPRVLKLIISCYCHLFHNCILLE
jgi:CCR4-NOT transcription complex subunit 9